MTKYLVEGETLSDIADAIREQTGEADQIPLKEFANKVASISGGKHTYSTTEQEVGEWIDGSTVYEKTIILESGVNLTRGSWTSISAITLSGDEDIILSTRALLPSHKSWANFAGKNNSGTFQIFSETAFTIQGVIIQYTKTTAAANLTKSQGPEEEKEETTGTEEKEGGEEK